MRRKWIVAASFVLSLGAAAPALALMMGAGDTPGATGGGIMGGMMGQDMMGSGMRSGAGAGGGTPSAGCSGGRGQLVAFESEAPWITAALAHEKDLGLSTDQVKALTGLRDAFQKESTRLAGAVRTAEGELRALQRATPVDLAAVEAKVRAIAGLDADLRVSRLKTLEQGKAVLTPAQREKLSGIARGMMRSMHGPS